jgi:hypothetical protein
LCILDNNIADRSGVLGDTHVVVTRPARWSLICCRPDEHLGGRNATDCQDARYRVPGRGTDGVISTKETGLSLQIQPLL